MTNEKKYWVDIEHYLDIAGYREGGEKPLASPGRNDSGVGRRDFLKLGSMAAVFSMLGCMQRPAEKIIPYLNRPEEVTPGLANYYATSCGGCSMACGMLAKVREGRPIKVEGNPDNPFNRGTLCARGQASVFDLYDPGRSRKPSKRVENGSWQDGDFAELDAEIIEKLKTTDGEVVLLTGPWHGPARNDLAGKFLEAFPVSSHVKYNPLYDFSYLESRGLCFGQSGQVRYRFDLSRVNLLLGADPFTTGRFRIENLRQFAATRTPEENGMSRLIVFEPGMSETGAMADERYPVSNFDLVDVAGALVNQLLLIEGKSGLAGNPDISRAFARFSPRETEKRLGLPEGLIAGLAAELWEARGKSLVLTENFSNQFPGSRALHAVGHLLNSILGNEGVTVESGSVGEQQSVSDFTVMADLVKRMSEGRVAAIIIDNINPAYFLPEKSWFSAALLNVPLRVSLSLHPDETSRLCQYHLPGLHSLESWGDSEPLRGLFVLKQPTISAIWENRQAEDTLLSLGAGIGIKEFTGPDDRVGWYDYLKNHWRDNVQPALGTPSPFEQFWIDSLQRGHVPDAASGPSTDGSSRIAVDPVAVAAAVEALPAGNPQDYSLVLTACSLHQDGSSMNNSWLLEAPHPVTRITWDNYLCVSAQDAEELGLREGDLVRLSAGGDEIIAPVHLKPGQAGGVVTIDVGWGGNPTGVAADRHGANAFAMAALEDGRLSFCRSGVKISKAGGNARLASVQGWPRTLGRPIVFETTFEEFRHDPKAGQFEHAAGGHAQPTTPEHHHPSSIWGEEHPYPGHRWGMVIDLNKCNGCGACTVACQVENNIPFVGKREVLNGREMHWIRIDRYFSGSPDNPDPLFQPMLCQHCDHAPCETVCPVLATMHNDEGLNVQVYNRCVGTRYCSNNCPYKVRRFNFYEFSKDAYAGKPLKFTLNPDVTVREKGVMEKCTFCLQRIRAARYKAKQSGVPIGDGDVVPACAQTCPTGAITFGDLNDPESRVAKLYSSPRSFQALAELNTRPKLAYMTLVRNRAGDYAPGHDPNAKNSHG